MEVESAWVALAPCGGAGARSCGVTAVCAAGPRPTLLIAATPTTVSNVAGELLPAARAD